MRRTLRGAWSRRWTLLPLLLLTVVVVGGTVTVVSFAEAAGTSRLLALPLLLVGLVAVPGTARELALARRGEIALARLRGLRGVAAVRLLVSEPLLVLVIGGVVGLALGLVAARVAAAVWADATPSVGWRAPAAGLAIVVVALGAVVIGTATALREPLSDQVRTTARPRPTSVLATFGSVLVVAAAVVAVYRSRVASGAPDWVVLAGPALVGLACGEAVAWLLRLGARLLVPLTAARGLGGFLAARRVARVAGAATSVRILVAAAAVAGLALTGSQQVSAWTDDTARLRAGAPLRIDLDVDAADAVDLTHRLDPDGRYLMAAVLVPGSGSVPARRAFLDAARFDRVVGDFYAGTPAATVGTRMADLAHLGGRPTGLALGSAVTATVQGIAPRDAGALRPRVVLGYRNDQGVPTQARLSFEIGLDGAPATVSTQLPDCADGCVITQLIFLTRRTEPYPYLLSRLDVGDLDALHLDWQPGTRPFPGVPKSGPRIVDDGLLATAPTRFSGNTETTQPADTGGSRTPILATDTAHWSDDTPTLDSTGGDERDAVVLQRYAGLPLVERDGVLADLPHAVTGAPPTVPAAEVMVLARSDTPAAMLADLRADQQGPARTLAEVQQATFRASRSAQSRMYALMAGCCLLIALLVLTTAVGRQQQGWRRDVAALRVLGVDRSRVRGAGIREVVGLALAAAIGTAAGAVLGVRLLLGHLPLVEVPAHAVPLHSDVAVVPVVVVVVVVALVVAVVAGRGRRSGGAASRPAVLREEESR